MLNLFIIICLWPFLIVKFSPVQMNRPGPSKKPNVFTPKMSGKKNTVLLKLNRHGIFKETIVLLNKTSGPLVKSEK
jgi:hypothetical protein